eukprot:scaffold1407_cov379-Pavlova_lutheri.AAC.3
MDAKLRQDVNSLMMSYDWALRQCVEQYKFSLSNSVIEASWCEALKPREEDLLELKVHSNFMEVCLADFFHRTHEWDTLHQQCSCWRFLDKEVCEHICAKKVAEGLQNIPGAFKIFQFLKFRQLKIHSMRSKAYKQRARDALNHTHIKRMKYGEQELRELVLTSRNEANLPSNLN